MPPRPVLLLPHAALSSPAVPVGEVSDSARAVGRDLLDTMRDSAHSVGVAGPQIGVGLRVFCIDVTGHPKAGTCHGEVLLFDPVVVLHEGTHVGREGCMSVPDLTGDVARAARIVVRGLDIDGREQTIDADAFEARAIQHELDHLDGLLFLDRVVSNERVFRRRTYR